MTKLHGIGVMLCELRLLAVLSFFVLSLTSSQTCYLTQEFFLLLKKNC